MESTKETRPGAGWRKTVEAQEVLGIPCSTWEKTIRQYLPETALQAAKNGTWVHVPSVVQFLRERERERVTGERNNGTGSLSTPDGSLEAKRVIETKIKDLELRRQLGELVPLDEFSPFLMSFANRLSTFAESIGRKTKVEGVEVQRGINEIIDETMKAFSGSTEES